jgi:hypothetical protein
MCERSRDAQRLTSPSGTTQRNPALASPLTCEVVSWCHGVSKKIPSVGGTVVDWRRAGPSGCVGVNTVWSRCAFNGFHRGAMAARAARAPNSAVDTGTAPPTAATALPTTRFILFTSLSHHIHMNPNLHLQVPPGLLRHLSVQFRTSTHPPAHPATHTYTHAHALSRIPTHTTPLN